MHGGSPGSGRPIIHGRYSKLLPEVQQAILGERARQAQERLRSDLLDTVMAGLPGIMDATEARSRIGDDNRLAALNADAFTLGRILALSRALLSKVQAWLETEDVLVVVRCKGIPSRDDNPLRCGED